VLCRANPAILPKDAASWFETRGVAALLTMRVQDLILRSLPQAGVSKDEATELENAPASGKPRA
jgi:hypothetical protein